jgi:hypothetical protein
MRTLREKERRRGRKKRARWEEEVRGAKSGGIEGLGSG